MVASHSDLFANHLVTSLSDNDIIAVLKASNSAKGAFTPALMKSYLEAKALTFTDDITIGGSNKKLIINNPDQGNDEATIRQLNSGFVVHDMDNLEGYLFRIDGDNRLYLANTFARVYEQAQFRDGLSFDDGVNVLSAYAKGTFNPTAGFLTNGDLSVSYTSRDGIFERIGDRVDILCKLVFDTTFTTSSGDFTVTDLPYTPDDVSALSIAGSSNNSSLPDFGTSRTQITALADPNSRIRLGGVGNGELHTFIEATEFDGSGSTLYGIIISGHYFI